MSLKLWMARNAKVPVTFARSRKESQSRNKQRKEARLARQEVLTCKNALLALARHLQGSWYVPVLPDDDGEWQSALIDDVRDDKIHLEGQDFYYSFNEHSAQFMPVHLGRTLWDPPSEPLSTSCWHVLAELKTEIETFLELLIEQSPLDEGVIILRERATGASVCAILRKGIREDVYYVQLGPRLFPLALVKPFARETYLYTQGARDFSVGLGDLQSQCRPLWLRVLSEFVSVRELADLVLDLMIPNEELLCDMWRLHSLPVHAEAEQRL